MAVVSTYEDLGIRSRFSARYTKKTDYVYDGMSLLALTETSGASTQSLVFLYGQGPTPVGALYQSTSLASPLAFSIVSDVRGDVREMRDSTGAAFARFDYDAFGAIRSSQTFATGLVSAPLAASIVAVQPLRYAGYVWDMESNLYYCSQRYYDPTIAAFISKDPIKADGEMSLYGYCAGEPVGGVDPSGFVAAGFFYCPPPYISRAAYLNAMCLRAKQSIAIGGSAGAGLNAGNAGGYAGSGGSHTYNDLFMPWRCMTCEQLLSALASRGASSVFGGEVRYSENDLKSWSKPWDPIQVTSGIRTTSTPAPSNSTITVFTNHSTDGFWQSTVGLTAAGSSFGGYPSKVTSNLGFGNGGVTWSYGTSLNTAQNYGLYTSTEKGIYSAGITMGTSSMVYDGSGAVTTLSYTSYGINTRYVAVAGTVVLVYLTAGGAMPILERAASSPAFGY